jgi:hypothetical protein
MKDHAERVTPAEPQAADAVPQVDAIDAPCSLDGTVMDREHHAVTATERHDFGP